MFNVLWFYYITTVGPLKGCTLYDLSYVATTLSKRKLCNNNPLGKLGSEYSELL